MTQRGRRSRKQLEGVSSADMTPAEYARSNDDHYYLVTTAQGAKIRVKGIHSARAVAGKTGTFERES